MRDRLDIPDPSEVSRRIGVGVPLDGAMTVGEWLETWGASKKTKTTTTNGYRSHIRVHLKPGVGHYRLDRFNVGHVQEFFDGIDAANEVAAAENQDRREQEARAKCGKNSRPGPPSRSGWRSSGRGWPRCRRTRPSRGPRRSSGSGPRCAPR
ncbi:hypothetical protein ACFV3F_20105 [Streptomyces sp. NPDC059717]|uniref:hypothetical protein n=1 Tax=Streptomyces sp. NPDC059717 TaxID=3346922 RepID=UPI00368BA92C